MQRIIDFLEEAGFYFLATVDGDSPRIRPFGSHILFDGKLYICMGDFKDVYKQLAVNPQIAIGAIGKDGKWLRIAGELVFDENKKAQDAMYEAIPSLHDIYDGVGIDLKVAYIANGHVQFQNGETEPEEYDF